MTQLIGKNEKCRTMSKNLGTEPSHGFVMPEDLVMVPKRPCFAKAV